MSATCVTAGQVVARLDPQNQQNALRSAQANLPAAQAPLTQARNTFERQQELLKSGCTPRARFDDAQQALQTAQAQVDSAQAQLRNRAGSAWLHRPAPRRRRGRRHRKGAEPGEVVRGRADDRPARPQGGRDAVFDVPAQLIRTGPRDPVVRDRPHRRPAPCGPRAACGRWRRRPIQRPGPSRSRSASPIRPKACGSAPP